MSTINSISDLLRFVAIVSGLAAVAIIVWYLVRRPPLGRLTKTLLLLGLGLLPIIVSFTGNIAGYEYTLSRQFCGSCHVMGPYVRDAADPGSQSLAAIHSRNHKFGGESCYMCHSDYSMFGAITTKLTGLKHLYYYITEYANTGPDGEGGPTIHLYRPFQNATCMQCHSTAAKQYVDLHKDALDAIRSGDMQCIDCHSEVHPTALQRRPGAKKTGDAK